MSFTNIRHIPVVVSGNSSGGGSTEVNASGELRIVKFYAATTGAYLKVVELVNGETVTLTGDTLAEKLVTGTATIKPRINTTDVSGAALGSDLVYPTVDYVNCILASGGVTSGANVHLYLR